jgi:hypothetical protein
MEQWLNWPVNQKKDPLFGPTEAANYEGKELSKERVP